MSDALDTLLHLLGFWRFILSKNFREKWIREYKRMGVFRKLLELIEAVISVVIGLFLPMVLVYLVLSSITENQLEIDDCLDSGGSYNYQLCECDYTKTHQKMGKHSCG